MPEVKEMSKNKGGLDGALKGMEPGDARKGFLPGGNQTRKMDYVRDVEELSVEDAERKNIIRELLLKWIEPNELSSRSNKSLDTKSLAGKLNRLYLVDMMNLLPSWFQSVPTEKLIAYRDDKEILSAQDKAEIQERYKDISP